MKYNIFFALFVFFAILSCKQPVINSTEAVSTNTADIKTDLSAAEFDQKIKEIPDAKIIDVRTPEEFSEGHLTNAENIDWNGNDFNSKTAALDKTKPVFVYCLSGGRSSSAAEAMRNSGFKEVYELDGGIMKWRAANLPEVTANATVSDKGMTLAEFQKTVASDKKVLVDFYADWCEPCKKMKPYLDEISSTMTDKVKVVRIDADKNTELCKELKIDALPVLHIYENNKLVWQNQGFVAKETVLAKIK